MKSFFLLCFLISSFLGSAQIFKHPFEVIYPPLGGSMPYHGFQWSNDTLTAASKYSSYTRQIPDTLTQLWKNADSTVCAYNKQMIMVKQITYKPASSGWIKYMKGELVVDASGNPQTNLKFKWLDSKNKWQCVEKRDYVFDLHHRILVEQGSQWRSAGKSMEYVHRNEYKYDTTGNELLHMHQIWDTIAEAWANDYREIKIYDGKRNMVSFNIQCWDKVKNDWAQSQLHKYSYDQSGNEIIYCNQTWTGSYWKNSTLDSEAYNFTNRQTLEVNYSWRGVADSGYWELNCQRIWNYSDPDNEKNYVQYMSYWNKEEECFNDPSIDTWSFDKAGNLLDRYMAQIVRGKVVKRHQDSITYDLNGNVIFYYNQHRANLGTNYANGMQYLFYYLSSAHRRIE